VNPTETDPPANPSAWEIRPAAKRPIGLAKGELVIPDDFDDPLPDDVLDAFEGN
jgi:hypothetical protein